ncbi:MAG: hypothetical protein ACKOC5_01405 [Chloroflexota bacterium]
MSDTVPSPSEQHIPAEQMQVIVYNTIAALTSMPERYAEWRGFLQHAEAQAGQAGSPAEQEFFAALLALMCSEPAALPAEHSYAGALQIVLDGLQAVVKAVEAAQAAGLLDGAPGAAEAAAAAAAAGLEMGAPAGLDGGEALPSDLPPGMDEPPAELRPFVEAVSALLDAPDWLTALALVQRDQALLFDPQAEQVFTIFLVQAGESGDAQAVDYIANHRAFVNACRRDGFDAIAARLRK